MLSCSVTKTVRSKPQPVSKKETSVEKKAVKIPLVVAVKLTQEQKVQAYLNRFGPIARAEMQQHKIPASITLAQGILESGTGEGRLAKEGNNHFGIKCHRGWNGGRMYHDDDAKGECFRTYDDPCSRLLLFLFSKNQLRIDMPQTNQIHILLQEADLGKSNEILVQENG